MRRTASLLSALLLAGCVDWQSWLGDTADTGPGDTASQDTAAPGDEAPWPAQRWVRRAAAGSDDLIAVERPAGDYPAGGSYEVPTDDGAVAFYDDGVAPDEERADGLYTATLAGAANDFLDWDKARAAESEGEANLYDGRHVVGAEIVASVLPEAFDAGELLEFGVSFAPPPIIAERALLITDPLVVADPTRTYDPCSGAGTAGGEWTFGALMSEIAENPGAGGAQVPSDFAAAWLATWEEDYGSSGDPDHLHAVLEIAENITDPWRAASGGGALDMDLAPFRLLAIVNRIDQHTYSPGADSGELRFVFVAIDLDSPTCKPMNHMVILEYQQPEASCAAKRRLANGWLDLQDHAPGSAAYNDALAALTAPVTQTDASTATRLEQLRSFNAMSVDIEWREHQIDAAGDLVTVRPFRSPATFHNFSPIIASFVNANEAAILDDTYTVPDLFDDPAAGGATVDFTTKNSIYTNGNGGGWWDGAELSNQDPANNPVTWADDGEALHLFSLNTCRGCHSDGETDTQLLHVGGLTTSLSDLGWGDPAPLSGFLTGVTRTDVRGRIDPATGSVYEWTFDDLHRRGQVLWNLANASCKVTPIIRREPSRWSH